MNDRIDSKHSIVLQSAGSIFTILVGFLVLFGWFFDISFLKSVTPGSVTMKPNTAVCFLLFGISLWILRKTFNMTNSERQISRICSVLILLISLITLAEYIFGSNFGVDHILFEYQTSTENILFPGRMSPTAAFCFLLTGSSMFLATIKKVSFYISQFLNIAVAFISFVIIAAYVYNVKVLYQTWGFEMMAIHSAVLFLTGSVSLLYFSGKQGITAIFFRNSPGGIVMRRLILAIILVPFIFGWLRLRGEYAGLYGTEFGLALNVSSNVIAFIILTWWSANVLDETEGKRQSAKLEVKNLASIVEFSDDAIISKDTNGKILTWNKGAELMFGYKPEEIVGQNITILFPPELLEEEEEILAKFKSGQHIRHYETVRKRKDGSRIDVSLAVSPLKNDAGEVIGASKIARDITDQKRAEESLRESENRLTTVIENLAEGLIISDFDGNIILWNPASLKMHGFSDQDNVTIPLIDFTEIFELSTLDGKVLDFEEWIMPRVLKGENLRDIELKIRRVDIDWERIFSYSGTMVKDANGKDIAFLTITDITNHKLAEESFREAVEFNLQIINNAQEGIIVLDKDLRYVVWNHFLENLTGFSEAEVIGKTPLEVFPDLRDNNAFEAIKRALAGETIRPMDIQVYSPKTDESRWVTTTHSPHYSASGEILGVIITISDITERKQNEEEILQLNETLEQRVADRTAELNSINKELEAFTYSVSHDLRAPLRAMYGFSLALSEDYADILDETGQNYLSRVRNASSRMAHLIDDMLRLSRVTRSEIHKTDVNLSEIVENIVEGLQTNEPRENVKFEVEENIYAHADERLIRIALENLLGNAYKFTSKKDSAKIIFGHQENGKGNEYFVKDNGAGFEMNYIDKIFAAFQRLHRDSEFEGTGIGLATVQRIIHKHGGEIRAEGKVGEGASFYFTL